MGVADAWRKRKTGSFTRNLDRILHGSNHKRPAKIGTKIDNITGDLQHGSGTPYTENIHLGVCVDRWR